MILHNINKLQVKKFAPIYKSKLAINLKETDWSQISKVRKLLSYFVVNVAIKSQMSAINEIIYFRCRNMSASIWEILIKRDKRLQISRNMLLPFYR